LQTGFIWLKTGISGGLLKIQWTFKFHKRQGIYWLAERLLASQERLCSMGLVTTLRPLPSQFLSTHNSASVLSTALVSQIHTSKFSDSRNMNLFHCAKARVHDRNMSDIPTVHKVSLCLAPRR
jgi:hypothetical protein